MEMKYLPPVLSGGSHGIIDEKTSQKNYVVFQRGGILSWKPKLQCETSMSKALEKKLNTNHMLKRNSNKDQPPPC